MDIDMMEEIRDQEKNTDKTNTDKANANQTNADQSASKVEQTSFAAYHLSAEILETLKLYGFTTPTDIQAQVIPLVLAGKNVVARSQTGTGKTAAFAVPLAELVSWEGNLPQALVLEPTRELAVQVQQELFAIGRKKRLKVPAVFGGFPIDKQIQTLRQKSHVVVGTPGRIMDLLRRDSLKLEQVRHVVIDEADLMLDMGFLDEVKEILSLTPEGRQVLLFSATLQEKVQQMADDSITDAVFVSAKEAPQAADTVEQYVLTVDAEEKYAQFKQLLIAENPESAMIFCGTREMVNVLFQKLRRDRIFCGMIHGELDQKERLKTVDAFKRGGFRYLIATDVAARGIDFEKISHVFNYDFPTGRETYVHRIGRTGRNGAKGTAVSLVTETESRALHMVEEYLGTEIPKLELETSTAETGTAGLGAADQTVTRLLLTSEQEKRFWAGQRQKREVKAPKGHAVNAGILRLSIGGGRKSKMRAVDIVGTICSIEGITAEEIGIIDVRESLTYVEILNGKGPQVLEALQNKTIKGKIRKVRASRG